MWPVAKKTRRRSRGRRLRHSGQNRKVRQASDSTIVPSTLCVYPETKVLQSNPHALREHCIKKWRQISTGCILILKLNSPDRSVFVCMFHFYLCKTEIAQCVAFHRDTVTMIPTCASCLHWLLKIIYSCKLNQESECKSARVLSARPAGEGGAGAEVAQLVRLAPLPHWWIATLASDWNTAQLPYWPTDQVLRWHTTLGSVAASQGGTMTIMLWPS